MKNLFAVSFVLTAISAAAQVAAPPPSATLNQTVLRDPSAGSGCCGYRTLVPGPGEPYITRYLFPNASVAAVNRPLLAFAHMTDLHVTDDESPLRVQWLDRFASQLGTGSAYRAHETLTTQIADSMARAIRNAGTGPRTGLPLKFTLVTGDSTDNMQYNETRWYINVLDGTTVVPKSGGTNEESVMSPANFQSYYWHPEALRSPPDAYQRDFKTVPGLLASSRRAFQATGLGMPWYTTFGNHDATVQGNLPMHSLDGIASLPLGTLNDIATGGKRIFDIYGWPTSFVGYTTWNAVWDALTGKYTVDQRPATSDAHRRLLSRTDFMAEHFKTVGTPAGHGYVQGSNLSYYAMPSGPNDLFQFIALDTTNSIDFGPDGWIDNAQFDWLTTQLKANSAHFRGDDSNHTLYANPNGSDKLIVLYMHHTLNSMGKVSSHYVADSTYTGHYVVDGKSGSQLQDLLLKYPNVIMVVDGHTHANNIWPHSATWPDGGRNGFWEINSSSGIDWPVQSRLIEVAEGGGALSIFTTMLDADAPLSYRTSGEGLGTTKQLASLGRELIANDPDETGFTNGPASPLGVDTRRGVDPNVRNTQLVLPTPFTLPYPIPDTSFATSRGSDGKLEIFWLAQTPGQNPTPYHASQITPNGSTYSAWQTMDGSVSAIASATYGNGLNALFGVSFDQLVWYRSEMLNVAGTTPNTFLPWKGMDGGLTSIAATPDANGNLYVIGVNSANGGVFHRHQTSWYSGSQDSMTWSPWVVFPNNGASRQVAATTSWDGRVAVFSLAGDGSIWTTWQHAPGVDTWDAVYQIDGNLSSIAVAMNPDGRLEMFGTDSWHQVFHRSQTYANGAYAWIWNPWVRLDGAMSQVATGVNQDGRIELFGIDPQGQIFHRAQVSRNASDFTSWVQIGGTLRP